MNKHPLGRLAGNRSSALASHEMARKKRSLLRRRRQIAEQLEPRLLLAGDVVEPNLPESVAFGDYSISRQAEGESAPSASLDATFSDSLGRAIEEISRVITALAASPEMDRSIPYLGSLLPVSVGDSAVIDTFTIGSLFDLAQRFDSEVANPLRDYLEQYPTATPAQLVAQFDFLEPVNGLSGGAEGVRLNLESGGMLSSSLAALLSPVTTGDAGILRAIDGDALATSIPLQYGLEGFQVDVIRDVSGQTAVGLPGFSIDIAPLAAESIDFAAAVGFLSGQVTGGQIQFDLNLGFDPRGLFTDPSLLGTALAGRIGLDTLRSISANDIAERLRLNVGGTGLNVSLPFDFNLAGFDTGSLLPEFALADANPLDDRFPALDLIVPAGAPYSVDSLLAFHSIDATSILGSLEQLGGVLGSWEQGSLLNVPIPLAAGVTLGDAIGLAEAYGDSVLQFLRDPEGFPEFASVQELADLIPAASGVGPIESLSYDPATQTLNISLEFFRQGQPIDAQADLSLFAGNSDRPLAAVEMVPGDLGTDNRLQITRNASLGLDLAIDLSRNPTSSFLYKDNVSDHRRNLAQPWTPMHLIMERHGLGYETSLRQSVEVQLRDGRTVELEIGRMNANTSISEVLRRGNVYLDDDHVLTMSLEDDRLVIADLTEPNGIDTFELGTNEGFFWSTMFVADFDSDNDGRITSDPLSQTWFSDFGPEATPLIRFIDALDPANLIDSAPLRVTLADGTSEVISLPAVTTMNYSDLAAAMTIGSGDETRLRTSFSVSTGRFVLEDLTTPEGDNRLQVSWEGGTGSPVIAKFIPIGHDADRDGRLEGPEVFPSLVYDGVAPIDRSVTLGNLLLDPFEASIFSEPSTLTLRLHDDTTITLSTGTITPETTLGDLIDHLLLQQGDQIVVEPFIFPNDDRLLLIDQTVGDGELQVVDAVGDFFFSWFLSDFDVDQESYESGITLSSESLSTRGFDETDSADFVLPPHLIGVDRDGAVVTLLDGSQHHISVGVIDQTTKLSDVAERLTISGPQGVLLKALIRDNRIILEDKTSPAGPDAKLSIELEDYAGPTAHFLVLAGDTQGADGILEMQSFAMPAGGQELALPEPPQVLVDTRTEAPPWTTLRTIVERNFGQNLITQVQSAEVQLSDGTVIDWELGELATTTIANLIAQSKWYRNDDTAAALIAQVSYDDGRLVLEDLTSGAGTLAMLDSVGEFWPAVFGEYQDDDGDHRLISDPLAQTALEVFHGAVPMVWFADYLDPASQGEAALIEISLRDGTKEYVRLGRIQTSLAHVLESLTVRRNGQKVVEALYENNRIVLLNRQASSEHPFSIQFASFDSGGSHWPEFVLNFGEDVDNDGAIYGRTFFPSLPDPDFPPGEDGTLALGIRVDPSTTLGDYAALTGLTSLLDQAQSMLVATLRDGRQVNFTATSDPAMTLEEYAAQFRVSIGSQMVIDATIDPSGGFVRPLNHRFVLADLTDPAGGETSFSVRLDPLANPDQNSRLPAMLGLTGTDAADTGVIVGPDLRPNTSDDRVRIKLTEPPVFHAEVSAIASNVQAEARLGELIAVAINDGNGSATASVDITLNVPQGADSISLADLLSMTTDLGQAITVVADADIEFAADVSADLGGLNLENPDPQPRIQFNWPDAITSNPSLRLNLDTLQPPTITNFAQLVQLKQLTAQDITELIRRLVDLVERISGDTDLLDRRLPLLNTSLGEALDTVDQVAELVDQIIHDPDSTLDELESELEQLLGLDDDELTLSYDAVRDALRLDVNLEIAPDMPLTVPLNLDLAAAGLAGLESLVDFQAQGEVTLTAGANLDLSLGLDLGALGAVDFDDAVIVYDTSGVQATAEIRGQQLAFTTAIGPLGVDVGPGTVTLDRDGLFGSVTDEPATLSISMVSQAGGVKRLSDLTGEDFEAVFDAVAGVDLPLQIGFAGPVAQTLQIHWSDLDQLQFDQVDTIDPPAGNQIVLPDLASAIDSFDLSDGLYALAAGIEGLFGLIDDYLGDQVLGIPVPLIGDRLSDAVDFLDDLKSRLGEGLSVEGIAAEAARQAIFDAIGPASGLNGGLGIIVDRAGPNGDQPDGQITVDDVGLQFSGENQDSQEVVFRLQLAQNAVTAGTGIDLDVGLPSLGLDVQGDLAVTFGYSIDIGFGISESDGVFVEFYDEDEISLDVRASVDDLIGEGRIGPLTVTARTLDVSELTESQRIAARLDPNDPTTEAINTLAGSFRIDLGSGRLSLADLGGVGSLNIETEASLVGSLHVQVETTVGGDEAGLPSIRADIGVNWEATSGAFDDVLASLAEPTIALSNVGLDLGSFISNVVAPTLQPINEFLDPLRPVLDALTTPIPVLSDIAGETTFTDLIGIFGDGGETVGRFIDAAADIARLIDLPIVNGQVFLPLGDFFFDPQSGQFGPVAGSGAFGGQNDFEGFLNTLNDGPLRDYLQDMPRTTAGGSVSSEPGKFNVPILTNPTSAVGLLFGQDVDLITYNVPRLEATFEYTQYIPIWPIFGITIGGSMSVAADFAFGYDTAGIRQFAESNRPQDLLNGFYLADQRVDEEGNVEDIAELEFRLGLNAGGQLNLLAVKAGVEGGLYAGIDLNLNDPNLDGKVRFQELADNFALGKHPLLGPLWIFDATGKLEAGVAIYAKAVGFKGELNIGPFTILDFDIPRPQPANPVLGHVEQGTLIVHVGPHAALREEGDLSDGDDEILISFDEETNQTIVSGFGRSQSFSNVDDIFIDAGNGNDSVVVDESLTIPIEIHGGAGSDQLQAGGGGATIFAGTGDDLVIGSVGNDFIDGGTGNDQLDGGEGDDTIRGGQDNDVIRGGTGTDRLHGDGGDDNVSGGEGSDFLFGGDGNDILSGGAGDDLLIGEAEDGSGSGSDFLQGGAGSDRLEGGPQDDQLFGGAGGDQLFGNDGNDTLIGGSASRNSSLFVQLQPTPDEQPHTFDGGSGDDLIYGTAGNDTVIDSLGWNIVETYEGDDSISLGPGNDLVRAGAGNDVISAGNGDNRIFAGAGFDIVSAGFGDDLIDLRTMTVNVSLGQRSAFSTTGSAIPSIDGGEVTIAGGNNQIFADDGPDLIITGDGHDRINGGGGNNVILARGGDDIILTRGGADQIDAGAGNNDVTSGAGDDTVHSGSGNDLIQLGAGRDVAQSGDGNDVIEAGAGDDHIDAAGGNDRIFGDDGNDTLVGGRGSDFVRGGDGIDVIWGGLELFLRNEITSNLVAPLGYSAELAFPGFSPPLIRPLVAGGGSVTGAIDDGDDDLSGDGHNDFIFGGGGDDTIRDSHGDNYIDAGAGDDVVEGGTGKDVLMGGPGVDSLRGNGQIDFLYGGDGEDTLRGDAGVDIGSVHQTFGQMLFGGPGNDTLLAYADQIADTEYSRLGDRLDGGPGADVLLGNLRSEVLIGGDGDDLLEGDGLNGPLYSDNLQAFTTGGNDILFGGRGDDLLRGGGGDDVLWGGADTDVLTGHDGSDQLFGGTGIDLIQLDVDFGNDGDVLDGHRGNAAANDVADDLATDILVIDGTISDDTIRLSQQPGGALNVQYNGLTFVQAWRDSDGNAAIEQFRINTLDGDDIIEFVDGPNRLQLSDLALRGRDWVGVLNAGSGDDTVLGSPGRDRISGGPGSDLLSGLAGDDRLFGDDLDGSTSDHDVLLAGTGNDDLIGGIGSNQLYAWSRLPSLGNDFGVFVDPQTGATFDSFAAGRQLEDTGLNRMLGREGDDELYGGTGLDFLYGGAGQNTLFDRNGVPFESGIGVPASDQWIEYARSTDRVWYYGATAADDVITVDYVTEPGVLGDHHLITRLTENNGLFTFDAQIRLDFEATDEDGNLIWDPEDLVYQVQELNTIEDDDVRRLGFERLELAGNLLPPEGDFLAILIDAGDGNDEIYVGPTVQRSVWVNAGRGDDRVEFSTGSAILVDLADAGNRNERLGESGSPVRAFPLGGETSDQENAASATTRSTVWQNLTLDNPDDVDWYSFSLASAPLPGARLTVDSIAVADALSIQLYRINDQGETELLAQQTPASGGDVSADPQKPARWELPLDGLSLGADTVYYIRVQSDVSIPTRYDLAIDLVEATPGGTELINLGLSSDVIRRDVIVGGEGSDVLRGGPGEDWVIGGPGNDVLSGGSDRGASDLLIGEAGDDILQLIPDALPSDTTNNSLIQTAADELEGGDGFDRVLFLGGDLDEFGRPVSDFVTLGYNPVLATYHLAALVWDTGNGRYLSDGVRFEVRQTQYRTRGVEATWFDLGGGDDELHLEPGYSIPLVNGGFDNSQTFGIAAGDRQAGGTAIDFVILGGDGNDRIFGSPYPDKIDGGGGVDFVVGFGGNDLIRGGSDRDHLVGGGLDSASIIPLDRLEVISAGSQSVTNDAPVYASPIDLSSQLVAGLTLSEGDAEDWFVVPLPSNPDEVPVIQVQFIDPADQASLEHPGFVEANVQLYGARLDPSGGEFYVPAVPGARPQAYLLQVRNPRAAALVAEHRLRVGDLVADEDIIFNVTVDNQPAVTSAPITLNSNMTGDDVAAAVQAGLHASGLVGVFVEFDSDLNRLVLFQGKRQRLTISGDHLLDVIGFRSGQTSGEAVAPLGRYQILTTTEFNTPSGGSNPVERFEYSLAAADPDFEPPRTAFDLSSDQPQSLSGAVTLAGDVAEARLDSAAHIGDFNGDGFDDGLFWDSQRAYLVAGPIDLHSEITNIHDRAASVIQLDGWTPVAGGMDADLSTDDHGATELAFYKTVVLPSSSIVFDVRVLQGTTELPRSFSVTDDAVHVARMFTDQSSQRIAADVQWLHYDNDDLADLMVIARHPVFVNGSEAGYGGVIQGGNSIPGTGIAAVLDGSGVPVTPNQSYVWIDAGTEKHADVAANIKLDGDWRTVNGVPESGFDDRLHATIGDVDADGQDEILLSQPQGWRFTDLDGVNPNIVVGRSYLVDTDGSASTGISLGNAQANVVLHLNADYKSATDGSRAAAMNQDQPAILSDLDHDGRAELIAARDFRSAFLIDQTLLIYQGTQLNPSDPLLQGDAVSVINAALPAYRSFSITAGDLDGDDRGDIVLASTDASASGQVTIVYDPLAATGAIDGNIASDQFADARRDVLTITGLSFTDGFGVLRGHLNDVTGDRIDDLMIGAGGIDSFSDGFKRNAGAVYLIEGQGRRLPLPSESDVITLANTTLVGLGEVLAEDGEPEWFSGRELTIDDHDQPVWFRFTTVGDGEAGDLLRIGPIAHPQSQLTIPGIAGDVIPNQGTTRSGVDQFEVGGEDGRTGVIEFDLSELLESYEDPSRIADVQLRLRGSASGGETPTRPDHLTLAPAGGGFPDRVFFEARSDTRGHELWVTDGTEAGTRLAFDAEPGLRGTFPDQITSIGHRVIFRIRRPGEGETSFEELYITDGVQTTQITHPTDHFEGFEALTLHDGEVYFKGEDSLGSQLWKATVSSDGDVRLTKLTSVEDDRGHWDVRGMLSTDAGLFFSQSISGDNVLWLHDGTTTAPLAVFDSVNLNEAVAYGGGIMFVADGGPEGEELWYSDGTSSGTKLIADTNSTGDSEIHALTLVDDSVFFIANSGELWQADTQQARMRQELPFYRPGNRSIKATAVDDYYVVAMADFVASEVYLYAADSSGQLVAQRTFVGEAVDSITTVDGKAILGYNSDGAGFINFGHLITFDPSDGSTEVLIDYEFNVLTPSFEQITTTSDNRVIISGPQIENYSRLVWTSDLTSVGTKPILSTSQSSELTVELRLGKRDQAVDKFDIAGEPLLSENVTLSSSDGELFTVPLTNSEVKLAAVRELFELGYRSVVATFTTASGTATIDSPAPGSNHGLRVTRAPGAVAALLDAEGRLIAGDFGAYDLRNLSAGTYYLRVEAVESAFDDEVIPLTILIDPPAQGAAHAVTDDDTLLGGDGDDLLVGGPGRDALFGNSGKDAFVAEAFEPHDAPLGEPIRDPDFDDTVSDGIDASLLRDPVVLITPESLAAGQVEFNDATFAGIVGDALGVPVIPTAGGGLQFAASVRASDLAGIVRLDASGSLPSAIGGLQYLVGLQTLDLSGNQIRSGWLRRLPGDEPHDGTRFLRHLNLDDNEIAGLANLSSLSQLTVLSVADQRHTSPLVDLDPLDALHALTYLDVSGNGIQDVSALAEFNQLQVLDLAGNSIQDLLPILALSFGDDSSAALRIPADFRGNRRTSELVLSGYYLQTDPRTARPDAAASWQFNDLAGGDYEVLASWFASNRHSNLVSFLINGQQVDVNQQTAPTGTTLDGITLQPLLTVSIDDGDSLEIILSAGENGVTVADAILVRNVGLGLPSLMRLDARELPLNELAHVVAIESLTSRAVQVDVDNNSPPLWNLPIGNRGAAAGSTLTLSDLSGFVSDPDGGPLTFTATSDSSDVEVRVTGSQLQVIDEGLSDRPVRITVTAIDSGGRSTPHTFEVAFGSTLIGGTVFTDTGNGTQDPGDAGLEGIVVYLDANDNGSREPGEPHAITDVHGDYTLWTEIEGLRTVRVEPPTNVIASYPPSRPVPLSTQGSFHFINFGVGQAVVIDAPPRIAEGSIVTASVAIAAGTAGNGTWQISGGPVDGPIDSTSNSIEFTPRDDGFLLLQYQYQVGNATYVDHHWLEVVSVAPQLNAGPDITIRDNVREGRFQLTRQMITDPGADSWIVTIDYGDGTAPTVFPKSSSRDVTLDHIYADPGNYIITVRVENTEGVVSDTLAIDVLPGSPNTTIDVSDRGNVGTPMEVVFSIDDPTFRADITTWSYLVEWGDGTLQSIASDIVFQDADSRLATARVEHTYASEAKFVIRLTVTDDDGHVSLQTRAVQIENDLPVIDLTAPATIGEDQTTTFLVTVSDADPIDSIVWDFGDATAPQSGATVGHRFAEPGSYTVMVTVTDVQGAQTVAETEILVTPMDDPPQLSVIPDQQIVEGRLWTYWVSASDPDGDALVYSLRDEPTGMTIDPISGQLHWTPSIAQGPGQYTAVAVARDPGGHEASVSFRTDVVDIGSILGRVFHDINGNGRFDATDQPLAGTTVRLDIGNDGVNDLVAQSASDGRYQFAGLTTGLYRVTADLPDDWEATTPTVILVEMTTVSDVTIEPIGGDADSDGDGVSNGDERNSPAGLDANLDGVPDWRQSNVVSVSSKFYGNLTLVGPLGSTLTGAQLTPAPTAPPAGSAFPYGAIRFSVAGLADNDQTEVELLLHGAASINAVFKFGPTDGDPTDSLYPVDGASISGNSVRVPLVDGSLADLDAAISGMVTEQFLLSSAASASAWQNPLNPFDVNNDGGISAFDALLIINRMGRNGDSILPPDNDTIDRFYDVTGDGRSTALDALRIINELARQRLSVEGETPVDTRSLDAGVLAWLDEEKENGNEFNADRYQFWAQS